jgi:hypothetical protein
MGEEIEIAIQQAPQLCLQSIEKTKDKSNKTKVKCKK